MKVVLDIDTVQCPREDWARLAGKSRPSETDLPASDLFAAGEAEAQRQAEEELYDRFFGAITPSLRPLAVGVAHEVQRSTAPLPASDTDIPLDGVITEQGWQRLPA